MTKPTPVIIDYDPGVDDVIALIMAFANDKLNKNKNAQVALDIDKEAYVNLIIEAVGKYY